jgi:hypothetical protein
MVSIAAGFTDTFQLFRGVHCKLRSMLWHKNFIVCSWSEFELDLCCRQSTWCNVHILFVFMLQPWRCKMWRDFLQHVSWQCVPILSHHQRHWTSRSRNQVQIGALVISICISWLCMQRLYRPNHSVVGVPRVNPTKYKVCFEETFW